MTTHPDDAGSPKAPSARSFASRFLTRRWLPTVLAALAVVLVLPSLWTGWQQDDITHRYFLLGNRDFQGRQMSFLDMFAFLDGDPERTRGMMDLGLLPWWTEENIRISFWRPLSGLTHGLDYALWPNSAPLMHVQSLLWFGALVAVVTLFYRRFIPTAWTAGLAALFYAVDDAHGLPAGWLAGRNAIVATLLGVVALMLHDRWRSEKWRAGAYVAPFCFAVALLAGETALAVAAYLVAHEVFLEDDAPHRRVLAVLPYLLVAVWWLALHRFMWYGTWGSGYYVDPVSEPAAFLAALITRGPILLLDQWGFPPSSISLFMSPVGVAVFWGYSMLFLAVLGAAFLPLLRNDRLARFCGAGTLLALPIASAALPHSRLLLCVGLGGMGLLAQWFGALRDHAGWLPEGRGWGRLGRVLMVFFIVVHLVVAPLMLPVNSVMAALATARYAHEPAARLELGPEAAHHDLVLVNPPSIFLAENLMAVRALSGHINPRRLVCLAPGDVDLTLTRTDERTLVIRPRGGYLASPFDDVFRGPSHPMSAGQRVALSTVVVEITRLTPDHRPEEAAFRFHVPLEDRSLLWMKWGGTVYVPFDLPAVGDTVRLPGVRFGS